MSTRGFAGERVAAPKRVALTRAGASAVLVLWALVFAGVWALHRHAAASSAGVTLAQGRAVSRVAAGPPVAQSSPLVGLAAVPAPPALKVTHRRARAARTTPAHAAAAAAPRASAPVGSVPVRTTEAPPARGPSATAPRPAPRTTTTPPAKTTPAPKTTPAAPTGTGTVSGGG